MSVTITIPADLETQLRREADIQRRSTQEVALDILRTALLGEPPTLDMVVADIRAAPPNPAALRLAHGTLLDALANVSEDEPLDVATWQEAWAKVETELALLAQADEATEGRR